MGIVIKKMINTIHFPNGMVTLYKHIFNLTFLLRLDHNAPRFKMATMKKSINSLRYIDQNHVVISWMIRQKRAIFNELKHMLNILKHLVLIIVSRDCWSRLTGNQYWKSTQEIYRRYAKLKWSISVENDRKIGSR
jgi:hypothetical protein